MTERAYKNHLRYKHMVARLDKLSFIKLEGEVLAELAKGKRWRIEAALDVLAKHPDRYNYINYVDIFEMAGRYGRLTAMHRLTEIYKSEKIDRKTQEHNACSHGILEAYDMATLNGHYRVARYLHRFGAQPNYMLRNQRHQRAMSFAIIDSDMKKIDFLLAAGASASYYLSRAVNDGNVAVTTRLLDAGADVNTKADGHWTPLHLAARRGDVAMVELLVARGATVQACANDMIYDLVGRTDVSMLDRLMALGAKPDQRDLEHAVYEGKVDFAQRMVDAGVTLTSEMLVHAIGHHKPNPAMIAFCLTNGANPKDAHRWLAANPDSYRHSAPGTRDRIFTKLEDLGISARKPPKLG